jgi:hypothetical protein
LGDPPFQATRKEIEAFWRSGDKEVLQRKRADGAFPDFIGLIYRLMPELPVEHDGKAWIALANEAGRGEGRERTQGRRIGRDLRDILVEAGSRSQKEKDRAKSIVEVLIEAGDFALVPDIIRYHMFAYGLVPGIPERGGPSIYDKDETRLLLDREKPRYRAFISSGKWLTDAHDTDVFFALEQAGGWDDALRNGFEEQLDAPGAVAALAELMIPPGWSLEKGTLDRFLSVERLRERMERLEFPEDPWLSLCFKRLRLAMQGEDPDSARSR